ncbi:sensor domain-containing protein [Ruania alkalisoli]|uniref:histidine kinase n=1 Tax=Ruania alkalisoli TaxID=2779775 RepID=A0A7M1SX80_9MICO|nr:sensor domain-containing protein [Ruania alkalisoli]QOR72196.1 sensor domain-containing protein [Ruania alkalisoli]
MTAVEEPAEGGARRTGPGGGAWVTLLGRASRETGYLLLSLPLAIAGFVVFVAGVSVGSGLLVTLLGLPVLAVTLAASHGLGNLDRRRLAAIGYPVPRTRPYRTSERGVRRILARLAHGQSWLDLLYGLLRFPVSIATFVIAVVWWVAGAGAVLYIVWERFLPENDGGLADLLGYPGRAADIALTTVLGALLLVSAPWVVRGLVAVHRGLARITLGGTSTTALREQVESLTQSRAAAVDAEADTLRRIERDIHDGPQQRLVRMSMDLRAAQRRLAQDDADAAGTLIGEAIEQVQSSLEELRALSRGIAPPVLADRGLRAAIAAVAGRSPIPVELDVSLTADQRLAAARESAAYFVVTEALANAAKHSGAGLVRVSVSLTDDDTLVVRVSDDGVGGAHVGKGHGLAGLTDRLAGIDGTLQVISPEDGGTQVVATL